jgi:DNA-directed RNA polymerase sigma subunit (sigma70/sigma32)
VPRRSSRIRPAAELNLWVYMKHNKPGRVEAVRKQVHSILETLTPAEAKALRTRFGMDLAEQSAEEEGETLRALARELAMLKKKKKQ